VDALVHVAVRTGLKDRRADALFDRAANSFLTAADIAFEHGKRKRAAKRASRRELTGDDEDK
jgi:hypothetical protein